ncbi:MAG: hypothetical protein MJ252_09425 [archaeon]|nr:hypothetical protein [archaeon]
MGAYFFNKVELGNLSCEEDLILLKHTANTGEEVSFSIDNNSNQNISSVSYLVNDFFKYLSQKTPMTLKLKKIKMYSDLNIKDNESLEWLIVNIQKYINKYILAKKFNVQKQSVIKPSKKRKKSSEDNSLFGEASNFYFSIDNDSISNQSNEEGSNSTSNSFSKSSTPSPPNQNGNNQNDQNVLNSTSFIKLKFNDFVYNIQIISPYESI